MSKRAKIIFGGCLLIAAILTVWASIPREPRYQGKSLSYWLDRNAMFSTNRNEQTSNAILTIGTNALPYLKKRLALSSKESALKLKISRVWFRFTHRKLIKSNWELKEEALSALRIKGAVAKPLLGELGECISDPNPLIRELAIEVITSLGNDAAPAIPKIIANLDSANPGDVFTALNAIHVLVPVAREAIPKVQILCQSTNTMISSKAKSVWERFQRKGMVPLDQSRD